MCGIAGFVAISRPLPNSADAVVRRMTSTLENRGPDGVGYWNDEGVFLGHRRLAILDLSQGGSQPMATGDGKYVLVLNGEIYNYRELASEFVSAGWQPRSSSDTEVLLQAIQVWGLAATLERVDGMFAFALYDRLRRTLTLARDRFGEKPLAFVEQNGFLWFASDQRAFDVEGGPELVLSGSATTEYFRYGYIPGAKSIYLGVRKVPPATTVTFPVRQPLHAVSGEGPLEGGERRYWDVPRWANAVTAPDPDEGLSILRSSIRDRLVSDRPVGAFLSGGIDSSLTCALAAELVPGSLRTFTMTWENREHDESARARAVANALGTVHHEVAMSMSDVSEMAEHVAGLLDEPHADYSVIGVNLVAREAREHFVVALSGDGGDELFGGYHRHAWLPRVVRLRRRLPPPIRRSLASRLGALGPLAEVAQSWVPVARRPRLLADKAEKLGRALHAENMIDSYESVVAIDSSVPGGLSIPDVIRNALGSENMSELLWALRACDLTSYLPDDVLTKVDRGTMAVSMEARTPFLHPGLAELSMRMASSELVRGSTGKLPLRRWLGQLLPESDFSGAKSGFGTPIAELLRGPLAPIAQDASRTFLQRPSEIVGDRRVWTHRFESLWAGDDSHAHRVWSAVAFELWASKRSHSIEWSDDG